MNLEYRFPRTFAQASAQENLRLALSQNRFPHALLLHGEPGLGQHALALDLAQLLSCESPTIRPCPPGAECPACRAFQGLSLETIHYLMPLMKKDKKEERGSDSVEEDALESEQIEEMAARIRELHERPYAFAAPEKSAVSVAQVRHLLSRLRYAENRRSRLVIVPCIETLHDAAVNALLKALEEPPAGVYFLIASEHRAGLLPTLLSRCLHLGLGALSSAEFREAAETLALRAGKSFSIRLLPFAEGSPGVYLQLLELGGEELLEEAARFLSAITAGDWRVFADYAEQKSEAKDSGGVIRLLEFLLRCFRLHQVLRTRHPGTLSGRQDGYRWTAQSLRTEGLDPSLCDILGPLEEVHPAGFAVYLESALHALQAYCQPRSALLGLFLEYDAKIRRHPLTPWKAGGAMAPV